MSGSIGGSPGGAPAAFSPRPERTLSSRKTIPIGRNAYDVERIDSFVSPLSPRMKKALHS